MNAKFFSNLQETTWYKYFLNPVIEAIEPETTVLDIGTGTGKLLEMAYQKNCNVTGIDTSLSMLDAARLKLKGIDAHLEKIGEGSPLPFPDGTFQYITICNVLFNLTENDARFILDEALRALKHDGKIIVLTPSGRQNVLKLPKELLNYPNRSILLWYFATRSNARQWSENDFLGSYCILRNKAYRHQLTFDGFAQMETIGN